MYGLDKNIDLSFLLNRSLEQVCIGQYDVQLHFHEPAQIASMSGITIDGQFFDDPKDAGPFLLKSLGSTILSVVNLGDGDLTLLFSSGQRVVFHDDDEHYETYNITAEGRNIIV